VTQLPEGPEMISSAHTATPVSTHIVGTASSPLHPVSQMPVLLTVEEAARLLRIGRTLMYRLISTGQVASVTVGRLRRVRPGDLETYAAHLAKSAGLSGSAAA
jgi:excisionase family DNA binding protein